VKKIVTLSLILFAAAVFAQQQATPTAPIQLKIGYVDSEVILQQFPEAQGTRRQHDTRQTGHRLFQTPPACASTAHP